MDPGVGPHRPAGEGRPSPAQRRRVAPEDQGGCPAQLHFPAGRGLDDHPESARRYRDMCVHTLRPLRTSGAVVHRCDRARRGHRKLGETQWHVRRLRSGEPLDRAREACAQPQDVRRFARGLRIVRDEEFRIVGVQDWTIPRSANPQIVITPGGRQAAADHHGAETLRLPASLKVAPNPPANRTARTAMCAARGTQRRPQPEDGPQIHPPPLSRKPKHKNRGERKWPKQTNHPNRKTSWT